MTGSEELRQKAYQLLEEARDRLQLAVSTNREFESQLLLIHPDREITVPFVFKSRAEKEALYAKVFSVAHSLGATGICFIADGCAPVGMPYEAAIEQYGSIDKMPPNLRQDYLCVAVSSPTYRRTLAQRYEQRLDGIHFEPVEEDSDAGSRAERCWAQDCHRSNDAALSTTDGDIGLLIYLEALFPKPWVEQIPAGRGGLFWMRVTAAGQMAVDRLMSLDRYEQCFDIPALERCVNTRYATQMFRRKHAKLVAEGARTFLAKYEPDLPAEIRILVELFAYENEVSAGMRDREHLAGGSSIIGQA